MATPKGQVGDASDGLLGPAVPPGQLDRLHAPLRSQRERPPAHQLRPVRQAGDLQIGPAELRGVLAQIEALGLELIELRRLPSDF
jgi:hypothetical protein